MARANPTISLVSVASNLDITFQIRNNSTPAATYSTLGAYLSQNPPPYPTDTYAARATVAPIWSADTSNNNTATRTGNPADISSAFMKPVPGRRYYLFAAEETSNPARVSTNSIPVDLPALRPDLPVASAVSQTSAQITVNLGRQTYFGETFGPRSDATSVEFQISTDPAFGADYTRTIPGVRGSVYSTWSIVASGLVPGAIYYVRARATAAYGVTAWSATLTFSASQAPAPTVSLEGIGNRLRISASSAFSDTFTVAGVGPLDGNTSPMMSGALVPNAPYTVEVRGIIADPKPGGGTIYTATRTVPYTLVAVNPPLPGEYFDGSFVDTTMTDYQWTGTANASISRADGMTALGWFVPPSVADGVIQYRVQSPDGTTRRVRYLRTGAALPGPALLAGVGLSDPTSKISVSEFARYSGSIEVTSPKARQFVARFVWYNSFGIALSEYTVGAATDVLANVPTRVSVNGESPAGADHVRLVVNPTDSLQPADYFDLDKAIVMLGRVTSYFDGSTPDTSDWDYSWDGTAHSSISIRNRADNSGYDPLRDPDCPPIPAPPRPPAIPSECITTVELWRRYWYSLPASEVSTFLTTLPITRIESGAGGSAQVRIRVFENPEGLDPSALDTDDGPIGRDAWISEQLVTHLPANTVLVLDSVRERALASVDGGEWLSADHLLYGPDGRPATWPALSCGIAYLIAVDVPLAEPLGNIDVSLTTTVRFG